jgi:mandelamide amidase
MLKNEVKAALVGIAALSCGHGPAQAQDLTDLTAIQALEKLQAKEITSEHLVKAYLEHARTKKGLNAYIHLDEKKALDAARRTDEARQRGEALGPLAGLPIAIKDNIHVAGMPNTAGTPALKGFIPESHAPVAQALISAGAIVLGKTNMHELAFGITTINAAFGAAGNAYAPDHIAGGSSGGTGSAVAARIASAGLGTDTGGSVRIPAGLNGLVGLRPTIGRYSAEGVTPLSSTRDTPGPLGRTVADVALLDKVIAGGEDVGPADLKQVRLGVARAPFWMDLDPETQRVSDDAIIKIKAAGVEIVDIEIPGLARLNEEAGFPIALYEAGRDLPAYLSRYKTGISVQELASKIASPDVKATFGIILGDKAVPKGTYEHAMTRARPGLQQAYAEAFARYKIDAIVFPTTPLPARPIQGSETTVELNGKQAPAFPTYIRNTDPGSVAGIPGITIPVGMTRTGVPIGLEFDGAFWTDRRLLSIAKALEAVFPPLPRPAR